MVVIWGWLKFDEIVDYVVFKLESSNEEVLMDFRVNICVVFFKKGIFGEGFELKLVYDVIIEN